MADIRRFELVDGGLLLIDGEHPHALISQWERSNFSGVAKYEVQRLKYDLTRVASKRDEERAKTTDAAFERKALLDFLRAELGHVVGFGSGLVFPFESFFKFIEEVLPHHRKRPDPEEK